MKEKHQAIKEQAMKRISEADNLDKLNDVNGYCKYMYLIDDKKYIRKLVEEGQKPIVTGCDVVRYMKLAEEYWMIKYNKINEMM